MRVNWCRSKLPEKAQPLPPIYQPEVAADGVYFASMTNRREVWVGGSTVKGIVGNGLAPGFADRYLARKGYSGQTTGEPKPSSHQDNLYRPAAGHFGARGDFDDRATPFSAQLWATKHRRALGLGALAAVSLGAVLLNSGSREAVKRVAHRTREAGASRVGQLLNR